MKIDVKPGDRLRLVWVIPTKNYCGQTATSEDGFACFARIRKSDNVLENVAMRDSAQLSISCACHPTIGRFAIFRIRNKMLAGFPSYGTLDFIGENVEIPIEEYREQHSAVSAKVLP